jgi:hypothetical protein
MTGSGAVLAKDYERSEWASSHAQISAKTSFSNGPIPVDQ